MAPRDAIKIYSVTGEAFGYNSFIYPNKKKKREKASVKRSNILIIFFCCKIPSVCPLRF